VRCLVCVEGDPHSYGWQLECDVGLVVLHQQNAQVYTEAKFLLWACCPNVCSLSDHNTCILLMCQNRCQEATYAIPGVNMPFNDTIALSVVRPWVV